MSFASCVCSTSRPVRAGRAERARARSIVTLRAIANIQVRRELLPGCSGRRRATPAGRSPAPPLLPDHHRSMLCGPSCRVRRRARRRRPAVPLRCRAKVRPSAFLCRLSCSVGRYAPSVKSCFILRRVTVYHRRSYRRRSHCGGHSHRSHSRRYRRRPIRGSWRSLRCPVAVGRRLHGPDPLPQLSSFFR